MACLGDLDGGVAWNGMAELLDILDFGLSAPVRNVVRLVDGEKKTGERADRKLGENQSLPPCG